MSRGEERGRLLLSERVSTKTVPVSARTVLYQYAGFTRSMGGAPRNKQLLMID